MTKYYTRHNDIIKLDKQHFLAKGGEKSIFIKGKQGWAIYHDPDKMVPIGKIMDLKVFDDRPEIITPGSPILYDSNTKQCKPIGHAIDIVDGDPLVKLFTTSFQKANGLHTKDIIKYVKKLQQIVSYIHSKQILIVDLNELNFLVNLRRKTIYAIDTNSYQTPGCPASAIMPGVFDRQCKKDKYGQLIFTENSDWYSFGILALQMICGIHPYKGGYQPFKHLSKPQQTEKRINENISVFNKDVTLPPSVRSFKLIPEALKEWLYLVFEKGERCPPPENYEATQFITVVSKILSNQISTVDIETFTENIVDFYSYNGHKTVILENNVWTNITKRLFNKAGSIAIAYTKNTNRPIGISINNRRLSLFDFVKQEDIPIVANTDKVFTHDGRSYILSGSQILELELLEIGTYVTPVLHTKAQTLEAPNATQIYDGVVIQNILGQHFASIFPNGKYIQVALEEVDNHRVIDAKYQNHVLMIIVEKDGKYARLVFRFNHDFTAKDARAPIHDINYTGLNFTVNNKGVCVAIVEDDNMEVFKNLAHTSAVRIIKDSSITNDMRLFSDDNNILIAHNKKLLKISLK